MQDRRLKGFAEELEAGTVVETHVDVEAPWVLSGWALVEEPRTWAYVACRAATGETVTFTIANRFDQAAFDLGKGFGWIGFRIDLARHWRNIQGRTATFTCVKSGIPIFEYDLPRAAPEPSRPGDVARDVPQLIGIESRRQAKLDPGRIRLYVEAFIDAWGHEEFVRRSYVYILNREGDEAGLAGYTGRLRAGMDPVAFLRELLSSDEQLRRQPGSISLPGDSSFPFYVR